MLKSDPDPDPDPDFCPFANHLLGSFLNIFESISDLKVICAQSLGHIEALRGPTTALFLSPLCLGHPVHNKRLCLCVCL